jgi:hypothetical protein
LPATRVASRAAPAAACRAATSRQTRSSSSAYSRELAQKLVDAFAVDFDADSAWHIGRVVGTKKAAWLTERPTRADVEPHDPASLWRRMTAQRQRAPYAADQKKWQWLKCKS